MTYRKLVRAADLVPGSLVAFDIPFDRVCVVNIDGQYYAFSDACPHAACPLSEGTLTGRVITCTCHGSEFDATTGEVLMDPADDTLVQYPIRENDGYLEVDVDSGGRTA